MLPEFDAVLGNTSGLSNKELIRTALADLVREVESGLVQQRTLERAQYALAATKRPRRPTDSRGPKLPREGMPLAPDLKPAKS